MGLREHAERAKRAATDVASKALEDERVSTAAEKARNVAEGLSAHEAVRDLDLNAVRDAAIDSTRLTNRKGKMTRTRVVRAAANPFGTAASAGKGASKELLRQRRASATTSASEAPDPADQDLA